MCVCKFPANFANQVYAYITKLLTKGGRLELGRSIQRPQYLDQGLAKMKRGAG